MSTVDRNFLSSLDRVSQISVKCWQIFFCQQPYLLTDFWVSWQILDSLDRKLSVNRGPIDPPFLFQISFLYIKIRCSVLEVWVWSSKMSKLESLYKFLDAYLWHLRGSSSLIFEYHTHSSKTEHLIFIYKNDIWNKKQGLLGPLLTEIFLSKESNICQETKTSVNRGPINPQFFFQKSFLYIKIRCSVLELWIWYSKISELEPLKRYASRNFQRRSSLLIFELHTHTSKTEHLIFIYKNDIWNKKQGLIGLLLTENFLSNESNICQYLRFIQWLDLWWKENWTEYSWTGLDW